MPATAKAARRYSAAVEAHTLAEHAPKVYIQLLLVITHVNAVRVVVSVCLPVAQRVRVMWGV